MLAWIFPKGPGSHPVTGGTIINKEIAYHIARFPDGTIRWAFRNEDPGWRWADTGYIATEGEWTHLAVVYEDGTVSTYAGGSLVHQYEGVGSFQQFLGSSLGDFRIGCRQGSSQNFHGLIDEVEVHDRAFPVEDVGRHMAVRQERQGLLTVEFPGDIFVGDSVGADTKRTPKTLNG